MWGMHQGRLSGVLRLGRAGRKRTLAGVAEAGLALAVLLLAGAASRDELEAMLAAMVSARGGAECRCGVSGEADLGQPSDLHGAAKSWDQRSNTSADTGGKTILASPRPKRE